MSFNFERGVLHCFCKTAEQAVLGLLSVLEHVCFNHLYINLERRHQCSQSLGICLCIDRTICCMQSDVVVDLGAAGSD